MGSLSRRQLAVATCAGAAAASTRAMSDTSSVRVVGVFIVLFLVSCCGVNMEQIRFHRQTTDGAASADADSARRRPSVFSR